MAQTPAAVQAALGSGPTDPRILIADEGGGGAQQRWYVDGGVRYPGRVKWVVSTASNSAANQATEITTALAAGSGYP